MRHAGAVSRFSGAVGADFRGAPDGIFSDCDLLLKRSEFLRLFFVTSATRAFQRPPGLSCVSFYFTRASQWFFFTRFYRLYHVSFGVVTDGHERSGECHRHQSKCPRSARRLRPTHGERTCAATASDLRKSTTTIWRNNSNSNNNSNSSSRRSPLTPFRRAARQRRARTSRWCSRRTSIVRRCALWPARRRRRHRPSSSSSAAAAKRRGRRRRCPSRRPPAPPWPPPPAPDPQKTAPFSFPTRSVPSGVIFPHSASQSITEKDRLNVQVDATFVSPSSQEETRANTVERKSVSPGKVMGGYFISTSFHDFVKICRGYTEMNVHRNSFLLIEETIDNRF